MHRREAPAPSTSSITASFSSRSSEQVEYTRLPPAPAFQARSPAVAPARWRSARFSGRSRHLISGFRPSVPVPEQGASSRIRSKGRRKGSGTAPSSTTSGQPSGFNAGQPLKLQVASHRPHAALERLRGLVARRGADVEEAQAGPGGRAAGRSTASRCPGCAAPPCVTRTYFSGSQQERLGDLAGRLRPVLPVPPLQKPAGSESAVARSGQATGSPPAFRRTALTNPAAERFPAFLTRSTLSAGRRMRRHPVQVPQLVHPHAQRDANLGVEPRHRPAREMLDQEVELPLEPQAPEHDLAGEPGVPSGKLRRKPPQKVGSEPPLLHPLQHPKCDHARRRHTTSIPATRDSTRKPRFPRIGGGLRETLTSPAKPKRLFRPEGLTHLFYVAHLVHPVNKLRSLASQFLARGSPESSPKSKWESGFKESRNRRSVAGFLPSCSQRRPSSESVDLGQYPTHKSSVKHHFPPSVPAARAQPRRCYSSEPTCHLGYARPGTAFGILDRRTVCGIPRGRMCQRTT